ncbi:nuclear transport factor 2 [Tanacetum coccineum]
MGQGIGRGNAHHLTRPSEPAHNGQSHIDRQLQAIINRRTPRKHRSIRMVQIRKNYRTTICHGAPTKDIPSGRAGSPQETTHDTRRKTGIERRGVSLAEGRTIRRVQHLGANNDLNVLYRSNLLDVVAFVGKAFVDKYDQILRESPEQLYRFYRDNSTLGRPEASSSLSNTTTINGIKAKIQSHSYGDYKFEIKSVDAQESLEGEVYVLVIGYLTGKEKILKKFTQWFLVAPMDNGYFVRNDMFRYIENNINHRGQDHAPNTQVIEDVAVLENYFPEQADVKQEKSPAENIFEFCDVPSDWEEHPGGDAALIDAAGKEVTYDSKDGAQSTNAKNFKERFNLFMQTPQASLKQIMPPNSSFGRFW